MCYRSIRQPVLTDTSINGPLSPGLFLSVPYLRGETAPLCRNTKMDLVVHRSFHFAFLGVMVSLINYGLAMAAHSGALAWKIPWTEEPGGLQSMGSLRVRHD